MKGYPNSQIKKIKVRHHLGSLRNPYIRSFIEILAVFCRACDFPFGKRSGRPGTVKFQILTLQAGNLNMNLRLFNISKFEK